MARKADNLAKLVRSGKVGMRIKTGIVRAWALVAAAVYRCWGRLHWINLWLGEGLCSELELLARIRCELKGQ